MSDEQQILYRLGVALAIGLLIGVERGWQERRFEEGTRIAGVRTYGLLGLLGGTTALLNRQNEPWAIGLVFLAMSAVVTAAYIGNLSRGKEGVGITSLVASLLTFVFGAMTVMGMEAIAAAAAVVATLLLGYKPVLHRWVGALEENELRAGIKLLLISVVLLPILPDRGYGPWLALNPYVIWWMVVLISLISFAGYFAIKIGGTRRGVFFTGLFGGLASSTAVTLQFSRTSRYQAEMAPILAVGVLLACGTMFPRMLLIASVLNFNLFKLLVGPFIIMSLVVYLPALWYWRSKTLEGSTSVSPIKNPLELTTALIFGVLLGAVMLLGRALQNWVGETGLLALAATSGLTDVDAITLSLARMSMDDLSLETAVAGIVIAAAVNNIIKGGMASVIGTGALGSRVGAPLFLSAVAGLAATWFWVW